MWVLLMLAACGVTGWLPACGFVSFHMHLDTLEKDRVKVPRALRYMCCVGVSGVQHCAVSCSVVAVLSGGADCW